MRRLLADELNRWKDRKSRKPVLLDGARQTGKSYLLEKIFGSQFKQVIRLDFLEQPRLKEIFGESLKPCDILTNIELEFDLTIDQSHDLIIFDEIGECQPAVDSLKFFSEQCPDIYLVASGSNVGLLDSFPVGKVEFLSLHPMTFEEFLLASEKRHLIDAFNKLTLSATAHGKLFKLLLEYYFVGGMPEAVKAWHSGSEDLSIHERTGQIHQIHRSLIEGYERDFGKYSDKVSAQHINAVFHNVPKQLSKNIDDSVKRFQFKDVIDKKKRYQDLAGPINWLEKCRLISKCHPIDSEPTSPIASLAKDNIFKLFLFDVGLLGYMLGITYKEHKNQSINYKGYIAENFVQNELVANDYNPTYSWVRASSEVEFLIKSENGNIYPLEVKSGKRTKAKSLAVYREKYEPEKSIKLIGSQGNLDDPELLVLPLYYAGALKNMVNFQ